MRPLLDTAIVGLTILCRFAELRTLGSREAVGTTVTTLVTVFVGGFVTFRITC